MWLKHLIFENFTIFWGGVCDITLENTLFSLRNLWYFLSLLIWSLYSNWQDNVKIFSGLQVVNGVSEFNSHGQLEKVAVVVCNSDSQPLEKFILEINRPPASQHQVK